MFFIMTKAKEKCKRLITKNVIFTKAPILI